MLMPSAAPVRKTLADIIAEKIKEKEENMGSDHTNVEGFLFYFFSNVCKTNEIFFFIIL